MIANHLSPTVAIVSLGLVAIGYILTIGLIASFDCAPIQTENINNEIVDSARAETNHKVALLAAPVLNMFMFSENVSLMIYLL